ncbi:uncharacterized protein MKK02DRAFT_33002 [Dioszegia hungarica]|uniref:Uncharacterized protein n=1 Tax=Dioszegia hungarica TaxID=4972 RepID=A0AA38LSA5_9TREE|nr:uncharacterized protein MKK02DRAFT_33002 [Dioszegia hungarica]KAI9635622.1 hypothetical protein MKK02DRAFT_33002 [Dioszegia hungarica]
MCAPFKGYTTSPRRPFGVSELGAALPFAASGERSTGRTPTLGPGQPLLPPLRKCSPARQADPIPTSAPAPGSDWRDHHTSVVEDGLQRLHECLIVVVLRTQLLNCPFEKGLGLPWPPMTIRHVAHEALDALHQCLASALEVLVPLDRERHCRHPHHRRSSLDHRMSSSGQRQLRGIFRDGLHTFGAGKLGLGVGHGMIV